MEVDPELLALSSEIRALVAPGTPKFEAVRIELEAQGVANPTYAEVSRIARERVVDGLGVLAATRQKDQELEQYGIPPSATPVRAAGESAEVSMDDEMIGYDPTGFDAQVAASRRAVEDHFANGGNQAIF